MCVCVAESLEHNKILISHITLDDEMDPDEINAINKSRKNSMVVF